MLRTVKEAKTSLSHCARGIRADHEDVPAFGALRLLQPKVFMEVLQTELQSYGAASAKMGQQVFETSCRADAVKGVAKTLRIQLGASDASANFLQDRAAPLQPSSRRVVKATFRRTAFAFKWRRWYLHSGVYLREGLVSALEPEDMSAQDWTSSPFVGEWPPPIACNDRMRKCAASGRTECERRVVMIVRSITQAARHFRA